MSSPTGQTTVPRSRGDTADLAPEVPSWAFVLLWSALEPHRVGEVAFLKAFETSFVGRGDDDLDKFAYFAKQRSGEPFPPRSREGLLKGENLSRRQLALLPKAVGVEMEQVGSCTTSVNGEEKRRAILKEGDTILIHGQALLLCVMRPRTLPGARLLHVFGGPDAYKIVGEGPQAARLRDELAQAAPTDDLVMLLGESGSGKELAAAVLHEASKRAKGPFVRHNASNFTSSVLDTQLYGHPADFPSKGTQERKGLVEAAHGGTLFLDEVGDCTLEAQAHMLRLLDDGTYRRVSEVAERRVDIRVIGATNRDEGAFRGDFRARFGCDIRIAPLRERREDIPLLIRHWLLLRAQKEPKIAGRFLYVGPTGSMEPRISAHLVDFLVRHPHPRNVRGLNTLLLQAYKANAAVEGNDQLKMPSWMRSAGTSDTSPPTEAEAKGEAQGRGRADTPDKEEVVECLAAEGGNVSRAAKRLGVHRNVLYRLMREYGIERGDGEA